MSDSVRARHCPNGRVLSSNTRSTVRYRDNESEFDFTHFFIKKSILADSLQNAQREENRAVRLRGHASKCRATWEQQCACAIHTRSTLEEQLQYERQISISADLSSRPQLLKPTRSLLDPEEMAEEPCMKKQKLSHFTTLSSTDDARMLGALPVPANPTGFPERGRPKASRARYFFH